MRENQNERFTEPIYNQTDTLTQKELIGEQRNCILRMRLYASHIERARRASERDREKE